VSLADAAVEASPSPLYGPLTADEEKAERKRLCNDYKAECRRAGVKVTDEMIAQAARKQWKRNRWAIQRWLL
jgi:hypothetical protein